MIEKFLKRLENHKQYNATKLFLTDSYTMAEIGQILGITARGAQRQINLAAAKLGYENPSASRLKQEYIWFLEQTIKDMQKNV